jgi:hypothetical protein
LDISKAAEKDQKAVPPGLDKVWSQMDHSCGFDTHSLQESIDLVPEPSTEKPGPQVHEIQEI